MTLVLTTLPNDYQDMLKLLTAAGAEFLIVGGWAMAAHGHTRLTKDLDLFVRPSIANAPCVLRALESFGVPLHGVGEQELATPGVILQVGSALRIDVTTTIDGASFDEASVGRIALDIDGAAIFVIGRDALIKNKIAANRMQDRVDVRNLQKAKP